MGLLSFLFGSKTPPPPDQPQGLLAGANQKAYRDYVIDAQSNGKAPLAYADWAKAQAQAKAAQPQQ